MGINRHHRPYDAAVGTESLNQRKQRRRQLGKLDEHVAEQADRQNPEHVHKHAEHRRHRRKIRQNHQKNIDDVLHRFKTIDVTQQTEQAESPQNDQTTGHRQRGNRNHHQVKNVPARFEKTRSVGIHLYQHFDDENRHAQTVEQKQRGYEINIGKTDRQKPQHHRVHTDQKHDQI